MVVGLPGFRHLGMMEEFEDVWLELRLLRKSPKEKT